MTFSYAGPASGPKDEVRFLLGDTNAQSPFLSDEEIAWLLSQSGGSAYEAAVNGCDRILIALAAMVDESVGEVSISFSQQREAFEAVYKRLRRRADMSRCGPIVGGISRIGKHAQERSPDRVKPLFRRYGAELNPHEGVGLASGDVGYPLGLGNIGSAYGDENGDG